MSYLRSAALLAALASLAWQSPVAAAEPFKKDDVIALVGGEDMVVASEYGYLEYCLTSFRPDYHLKFRNLAWEGDTVFEQPRQLNFPTWEEQLEKIGATVVICQFGQMESLAGKEKIPAFVAAYEKLLDRFSGGGKRRIFVIPPLCPGRNMGLIITPPILRAPMEAYPDWAGAIKALAERKGFSYVDTSGFFVNDARMVRDGLHLTQEGSEEFSGSVARRLGVPRDALCFEKGFLKNLLQLIAAKNRLWFDYWRPQNWAFLNGDRTTQPSSRDHRDPNVRWFPAEMEKFLPLIAAKEEEIWKLAAELK